MIRVMDSGRESMMKKKNAAVVADKCLDSQLWHACAGGMVQMPAINSKVFYFPQGHAEHSGGKLDLCGGNPRIPAMILCTVAGIRYMADSDTDDVYAKIRLIPTNLHHHHHDSAEDNLDEGEGFDGGSPENNKPASFVKTLTQSDANNGGGFSVPRYCAETIFPRLDYTAEPPVQAIIAKDVHGVAWKFRHIYRGTPRRHLLTTGWSNFVNQKRLVAGDSIVFLRAESGDLCVGIRRAKKGLGEYPFVGQYEGGVLPGRTLGSRGESVAEEAARLAAAGREFEVAYYPRGSSGGGGGGGGSTPEFCVRAAAVRAAAAIRWCSGMRFKMPFETEDSSRISWFMGTISSVQVADPLRWPDSPWRLLQVAWDEPDLLQNVKRVNPWLVELVANMPPISVSPFSPPRKKLRLPPTPEFPLMGQIPAQFLAGNFLGGSPFCSVPNTTVPAGIQGARHAQFGQYPSDLRHLSELHPGLPFPFLGFQKLHEPPRSPGVNFMNILEKNNENEGNENFSCWLKMGHQHPAPAESLKTIGGEPNKAQPPPPPPQLLLFGQVILTEEQLSKSSSGENLSGGSGSTLGRSGSRENFSDGGSPWYKDRRSGDIGPENGHCTEAQRVGLSTLEMSHSGSFVCLN